MSGEHTARWSRRAFLGRLTLAGAAGCLGMYPRPVAAEPPPETTTLRLINVGGICLAPQYVAEELLGGEGFADVQYLKTGPAASYRAVAEGEAHLSMGFIAPQILQIDAGLPIVLLAGMHVGCFELFGTNGVHTVRDLKGKRVAVQELGSSQHVFTATIVTYVGLDPHTDIHWVTHPAAEQIALLAQGQVDAYLGFPPEPQELRAKKIGYVIVNSALDRPWSQYFCCLVAANREFVRQYPVATKRALRAMLKAANICAVEPDRAARFLVDKAYVQRYDYALQTMQEVPYGTWREYNPEDTVRFYALRLHEVGMIKTTPQRIIAQGTDWRFLNELKKELKG